MKSKMIIEKLNSNKLKWNNLKIKKGKQISIIYYEIEKDSVEIISTTGDCVKYKRRGLNSKLTLKSFFKNLNIEQEFYLNAPNILDIRISK